MECETCREQPGTKTTKDGSALLCAECWEDYITQQASEMPMDLADPNFLA